MKAPRASVSELQLPLFPAGAAAPEDLPEIDPRPEIVCFRGQTLAIMRHFFELSSQVGRLPSLLGREFFRSKVSHHSIPSFEDTAVFTRDVELCLEKLSESHAEMITLIGLYDFSRDEVADMLHASRAWVGQRVSDAVDALSEIFLQAGLLSEDLPDRRQKQLTHRPLPPDVIEASRSQAGRSSTPGPVRKPTAADHWAHCPESVSA